MQHTTEHRILKRTAGAERNAGQGIIGDRDRACKEINPAMSASLNPEAGVPTVEAATEVARWRIAAARDTG